MECIVQGVIESQHIEAIENLLQGLSGVQKEGLQIRELILRSKPSLGKKCSVVRLLCDLSKAEPSWTVKHVGDEIKGEDAGVGEEQTSVLVRDMVESKTGNRVLPLFLNLGYIVDYELLKYGFAFRFQRGAAEITVTVSLDNFKLYAFDKTSPVKPGMHQVEVTAPVTAENCAEVVSNVSSFCEYLAPLLHLSKPPETAADAAAGIMNKLAETTL